MWFQKKHESWQFLQGCTAHANDPGALLHLIQTLLFKVQVAKNAGPANQQAGGEMVIVTPSCHTARISALGNEFLGSYDCHFCHAKPAPPKVPQTHLYLRPLPPPGGWPSQLARHTKLAVEVVKVTDLPVQRFDQISFLRPAFLAQSKVTTAHTTPTSVNLVLQGWALPWKTRRTTLSNIR